MRPHACISEVSKAASYSRRSRHQSRLGATEDDRVAGDPVGTCPRKCIAVGKPFKKSCSRIGPNIWNIDQVNQCASHWRMPRLPSLRTRLRASPSYTWKWINSRRPSRSIRRRCDIGPVTRSDWSHDLPMLGRFNIDRFDTPLFEALTSTGPCSPAKLTPSTSSRRFLPC